jgi:hypothetical protein
MTDTPSPGDGSPDARDDVLAAQLAVPALDEVTRRRLVRGALDAAPPVEAPAAGRGRGRGRWLAAAAAAVAVAGLVTAVVLAGGGSGDHPTAARTPASTSSPSLPGTDAQGGATDRAATPTTQSLAPPAGGSARSPGDLGPLGEVADPATLRDRVEAARTTFSDSNQAFGSSLPEAAPKILPATPSTTIPCAAALTAARPGLDTVEAVGTATFHGKPATVVVATTRTGRTVAVVIVDSGCAVHSPVTVSG